MNVTVVGSGKMGNIIIQGMITTGTVLPKHITATDHSIDRLHFIKDHHSVNITQDNKEAVKNANLVILCIKPQNAQHVAIEIAPFHPSNCNVVSIMAGVTLTKLQSLIPNLPVIRAMPNTPSQVLSGMTALAAGIHVLDPHMNTVSSIFSGIGKTINLDEKHFDAVTGLSASGPAFMYIAIEALADGGVKCGLPRDVAIQLASQMTLGAAKMVLETGRHPALLKDDVTTPAGCTTDGILALEEGGLRVTLIKAVSEATRRAAELG